MSRRIDNRALERRLREEAPAAPELDPEFGAILAHRREMAGGERRGGAPELDRTPPPGWRTASMLVAAAAVAIAAIALWPQNGEAVPRGSVAKQAIADALRLSTREHPREILRAIDQGDEPLVAESRRLLADAAQLNDRLLAPVLELMGGR